MANTTLLKIVTPRAQTYTEAIYSLQIKSSEGRITILPEHNPLMSPIEGCVCYIRSSPTSTPKKMVILEGIIYAEKKQIRLFSDYFVWFDDVDTDQLQKEIDQLSVQLEKETDDKKRLQLKAKISDNKAILIAYKDR
ncbi:ATP synthase F1 subunit epsilon [Ureaplasma canigenitalium]|uniref:ATP synthase F1 subunit epsilon n=1 Tax=Ureaplasma canigenitalium TaxID=42092 RepID=UPI0004E12084|nr:ATP synthase F1 subunit epsilon [Ureaplasma canigenitalium]